MSPKDSTDIQRLAHLVSQGDFGQLRLFATRQLVTETGEDGRTALLLVADIPETSVTTEKCILYLFELGANPSAADVVGDTVAHVAARRDNLRVLSLLPFDSKWLRNSRGATPLMEAARTGSWRCSKHLLHLLRQWRYIEKTDKDKENEAFLVGTHKKPRDNKRKFLLGLKDQDGRAAVDIAKHCGHEELSNYIEWETQLVITVSGLITGVSSKEAAARDELQRLVEAGSATRLRRAVTRTSCDIPDKWGRTAVMLAAGSSRCSDAALWQQLERLSDPTCAYVGADSSLHYAARSGNAAAASALLNAGAPANARDHSSNTPLMLAARYAPTDAAAAAVGRALLAASADWTIKDPQGRTALDLATEKGKMELAEVLGKYEGKGYYDLPSE